MAKSRMALETEIRNAILEELSATLQRNHDTDVLPVSTSEITIPVVDSEGNERFALIKVSIPRGTRNEGSYKDYDGYAAADSFKLEQQDKLAKKEASAAKKDAKIKQQERRQNARKVVKELNDKGINKMIHE